MGEMDAPGGGFASRFIVMVNVLKNGMGLGHLYYLAIVERSAFYIAGEVVNDTSAVSVLFLYSHVPFLAA